MIRAILGWCRRCRLYIAYPDLRDIDRQIAARRRQHRPVAPLLAVKRQMIHEALKGQEP